MSIGSDGSIGLGLDGADGDNGGSLNIGSDGSVDVGTDIDG